MITGALEHGSGPFMVECNHRFTYKMSAALIEYCRKNNGYLPEGKTIIQVSDELQPYYNQFSGDEDLMKENLFAKQADCTKKNLCYIHGMRIWLANQ
jgi:hypothetical protein